MARRVQVLARYSRAAGLPSVFLELEVAGMTVSLSPGQGAFLRLSGPPGGPLFLIVKPLGRFPGSVPELREAVLAEEKRPVVFGPPGRVVAGGVEREAILFWTGEKAASTAGGALAIPAGEEILVVVFGTMGTPATVTSVEAVASHPALRRALETLRAEWRPEDFEEPEAAPEPC
ncbi:MAG: hypothetical protein IT186_14515 [Acidobacteria bacterium]|nr:hypothetical protein [Acidobacteriota bacterium]MCG3194693.1 hypothetical protein [Thermoanaerobaculia bacterium]MCK6683630.1 hypothetical protein [Thermoanaerobaculia bacterium]